MIPKPVVEDPPVVHNETAVPPAAPITPVVHNETAVPPAASSVPVVHNEKAVPAPLLAVPMQRCSLVQQLTTNRRHPTSPIATTPAVSPEVQSILPDPNPAVPRRSTAEASNVQSHLIRDIS